MIIQSVRWWIFCVGIPHTTWYICKYYYWQIASTGTGTAISSNGTITGSGKSHFRYCVYHFFSFSCLAACSVTNLHPLSKIRKALRCKRSALLQYLKLEKRFDARERKKLEWMSQADGVIWWSSHRYLSHQSRKNLPTRYFFAGNNYYLKLCALLV